MSDKKESKEYPNLEKLDWRYHAATTLAKDWKSPYSGTTYKKGEVITTAVQVGYLKGSIWLGVPNTTALFLNLSHELYESAKKIFESLPIERKSKKIQSLKSDKEIFDYFEKLFGSIAFAFTAIESFANEYIPDDYVHVREKSYRSKESLDKSQIERRLSLNEKLLNILPKIFNVQFSKQKKIWHEYKKLENRRDRIIHMKSADRKSTTKDKETIWNTLITEQIFNGQKIAKDIIGYFIESLQPEKQPRWYSKYPHK